jgi:hypothetical protein
MPVCYQYVGLCSSDSEALLPPGRPGHPTSFGQKRTPPRPASMPPPQGAAYCQRELIDGKTPLQEVALPDICLAAL